MKREKIFAIAISAFFFCGSKGVTGQMISVVQDPGLNGQLKRMVFIKWDEWKPNNYMGTAYWNFTQKKYRYGDDIRPYKVGGKFDKDYAELMLQKNQEKNILEETKEEAKADEATYLSMSGGILDIPYQTYFKGIFDKQLKEISDFSTKLKQNDPEAFEKFSNDSYVKYYNDEFLPVQVDRIKIVNTGLADRGERILAYIKIKNDIEVMNKDMMKIAKMYHTLLKLKRDADKNIIGGPVYVPGHKTDKQIVNDILSKTKL